MIFQRRGKYRGSGDGSRRRVQYGYFVHRIAARQVGGKVHRKKEEN